MAKSKVVDTVEIVRELRPKDLMGLKGHGPEPKVLDQIEPTKRSSVLGKAFNWYNYFCTNKEAKQFIVDYLTATGESANAKKVVRVPDSKVIATYGWLARFSQRGYTLDASEKAKLNQEVIRLIAQTDKEQADAVDVETSAAAEETSKRNVQTVMRERASDVAGELQGLLDDYISTGCKAVQDTATKVVNQLTEKNILPQHISIVLAPWNAVKDELTAVQDGTDKQLVEGYSHLSKAQIKNILKFVDQVVGNINSYVSLKQTTKAKRTRKPVSVEKQVSKLKYMRKFKDDKAKLDLVSIDPTKLHNASEAWVYDTAKRRLYHYVADELGKCLIVKGSTLLGFDAKESETKVLRKPAEQLKQIVGSKPAARKFFKDIKAVATAPNGRFNANMIILKAW